MDANGPFFSPGDQKLIGQQGARPSSRTANRIYFFLLLGLAALGIGCLTQKEYVAGVIMVAVGVFSPERFSSWRSVNG
jgi:hypothetical protein